MQKPSFDTILENVCVIMPTAAYILLTARVTRLAGALEGANQRPRTKSAPRAPQPRAAGLAWASRSQVTCLTYFSQA